jgi:nitrous oxide reductase
MKLNIIVLLLTLTAILAFDTGAVFAQKNKEMDKPKFREESMRKFDVSNTTVQLSQGTMWIYDFGTITMHAYETKDDFGTFVFILEKEGKAVLLESPPEKDSYEELIDYIVDLGHSSIDLIVSYHPIGATFIKTDKLQFTNIYSMQHAVDNYTTGPGAPSLISLKKQFGELFDETIYKPTVMLGEGETEIAGITFEMTNVDFAFRRCNS